MTRRRSTLVDEPEASARSSRSLRIKFSLRCLRGMFVAICFRVCLASVMLLLTVSATSAQMTDSRGCANLYDFDRENPRSYGQVIHHGRGLLQYGTDADPYNGIYRIWNFVKNLGPSRVAFSWPKGNIGAPFREGLEVDAVLCRRILGGLAASLDYDAPISIRFEENEYDAVAYVFNYQDAPSLSGTVSTIGIEHIRNGDTFEVYANVGFDRSTPDVIFMTVEYSPPGFGVGISNRILGLDVNEILGTAGTNSDLPVQGSLRELLPTFDESISDSFSSMFGSEVLGDQFFILSGIGSHRLTFAPEPDEQSVLSIPLVLLDPDREPLAAGNAILDYYAFGAR